VTSSRPLRPADVTRQVALGTLDLSPDGRLVVYSRRTTTRDADRTALWLVPYAGGRARPLTAGTCTDTAPRFAPDGSRIAFLSDRVGGVPQLHVIAVDGGEATGLTAFGRGVAGFDWHPDGRRLVVVAEDDRSPWLVGERPDGLPTARTIARIDWRLDGAGLVLHPAHLHVVPLGGGAPRRLTAGEWSASRPAVSPDGVTVAFLTDTDPRADLRRGQAIHTVPIAGGDVVEMPGTPRPVDRFAYEPDGGIVALGHDVAVLRDQDPQRLFRVDRDGARRCLTAATDRSFGVGATYSDLFDWNVGMVDAGRITQLADGGRATPVRVGDDGFEVLVAAERDPVVPAIAAAGGRVVAVASVDRRPPEVVAIEDGDVRPLTREARWLAPFVWPVITTVEVAGPAGPITTFVLSPPGSADVPRATILDLHGGPTDQWNPLPMVDALLLVAAGYRVAMPNIRGSIDRGSAWVGELAGRWGDADAADCHAVCDHLVDAGLADPARLGVLGLSYGGFLVNWLVGTTDRFAAAVSENGVTNQVSDWANSDCGVVYCDAGGLGDPTTPAGVELLWRQSPLRNVAAVRTPILLLQGEADLRCPPADNEQLFVALRALGREVSYVLYPEGTHVFASTGRPDRRIDRHERVLAWFDRLMPA
jgi:dipeptidyl aminopeptidase/acylaminoacyl peptidase